MRSRSPQIRLRAQFLMDKAFRKTNLRLVPSWEARNHFCTEMGQALRKLARCWRQNTALTLSFSARIGTKHRIF